MNDQQMALAKKASDAERAMRNTVAPLWRALRDVKAYDAVFWQRVNNGDLVEMADYYNEKAVAMQGTDVMLRQSVAQLLALIEAMQLASVQAGENLFPGVLVIIRDDAPEEL